ncbi:MAG: hypothetical protein AAGD32_12510 [Planctomycetota bacterium]
MSAKVYSAGKALSLRKGENIEQVWESFATMFDLRDRANVGAVSLVYGGYRFDEKVRAVSGALSAGVGDVFRTTTSHQTPLYAKIISWKPHADFSFIEYFWMENESDPSSPSRTDVSVKEHPEGVMIEIIRREKGNVKTGFLDYLSGRKNSAGWAAGRLGHILGGRFCGDLKNLGSAQIGSYTVTRDDSLRPDFLETP